MKHRLFGIALVMISTGCWAQGTIVNTQCNSGSAAPGCVQMTADHAACVGNFYRWDIHWSGVLSQCPGGNCTFQESAIWRRALTATGLQYTYKVKVVTAEGCWIVPHSYQYRMLTEIIYPPGQGPSGFWYASNAVTASKDFCIGSD